MADPLCRYFSKCGGCSAQHIDYSLQLDNKRKVVSRSIDIEDVKVFSAGEYHYRNRMDLIFHPRGLGFRMKGEWSRIIDVETCVISNEKLNMLLAELRDHFKSPDFFNLSKHTGTFKYAVIRTPGDKSSISFVLNENSARLAEAIEKIRDFASHSSAENIIVTYAAPEADVSTSADYFTVKGSDKLSEVFLGKRFFFPVQGFFQNNTVMAEKMIQYSNELLKQYDAKEANLLDLYGGVGTFGILNASLFRKVVIVESLRESIDCADLNIKENSIRNANAILMDAKNLRKLKVQMPLYAITDPPRTGMHPKTIEELKSLEPEVIIYVSCNVQQLGKDFFKFRKYRIKSAAMFDLFPQTPHIETVVELVK